MTAKRLDERAILVALTVLALAPSWGGAQYDGRAWRLPAGAAAAAAAPGATRGVQQKPQPQVIVVQPSNYRTGFLRRSTVIPRTTVFPLQSAVVFVPAVVLADGRVFANFGHGFEQIFRSCHASALSGGGVVGQPSVIGGNGAVLTPQVPTYTQPVPNQQTASQQMAAANLGQTTVIPAYTTCFSQNAAGGVIVYRF